MKARESYKISFALALLELTHETKKSAKIYQEAKVVLQVLEQQPEFGHLISDLNLDFATKSKLLNQAFGKLDVIILNSMLFLAQTNRFLMLTLILKKLVQLLAQELKIQEGIVYSTTTLKPNQIKDLEKKLSKQMGSQISLTNHIDKELIGGFKVVIDDYLIDHSVKAELANLKHHLLNKSERE